ncbi:MAG: hypothetical protein PHD21_01410 [Flavobacteriales bacterium]|nr:hypothetical protein [Flavobacteriales bacterium]
MKHILYIALFVLSFCTVKVNAQNAKDERAYVITDKDNYVSGEVMWLKFILFDNDYKTSSFSKVAYIELADTQRPYVQEKIALTKGEGQIQVSLADDMPSGVYELCGYTRYMKNGTPDVFFKKYISVVNPKTTPVSSRAKMVSYEKIAEKTPSPSPISSVKVLTEKSIYKNRELVKVDVADVPKNAVKVVVSVYGKDSLFTTAQADSECLKKEISKTFSVQQGKYLPEYEGHIITATLNDTTANKAEYMSNISFVGEHIRYINGQQDAKNGVFYFYTNSIYGPQEIVSSVTSTDGTQVPYRLDIVSPFAEQRPQSLPVLEFYPSEKQITDRYVASQIHRLVATDSTGKIDMEYYHFPITVSYDLDKWKRFNTLSETLMEFVYKVSARKVGNTRRLYVFSESMQGFNKGNTLVLLDGVPIFNHGEILDYNPRNVKMLNIYDGKFIFANEMYDAIVSLISKTKDLPFFKLNDMYQLYQYKCPTLPESFPMVDYSSADAKESRMPDVRHTLYWNADVKASDKASVTFYTSDLSGDFVARVTVLTSDGKVMVSDKVFTVK